ATPAHSYLKMLYKYPQREYPYAALVTENMRRTREQTEYELLDTGVFTENRYFDVFVEYAQSDIDDVLMRITVHNRGPEAAALHVLPQLFFRNTWSWRNGAARPRLALQDGHVLAHHDVLGEYHWYVCNEPDAVILFTDNETNTQRLYDIPNAGY